MRDGLTQTEGTTQVKHPLQLLGEAYD
jgi:hypothetical protein